MYAKIEIKSNNRKNAYCQKGDKLIIVDSKKYPVLLVKRGKDEPFMTHADNLQEEPLELTHLKQTPENAAKSELKKELRKLLARDSYQFKIIFNRVYYGKVSKFPKYIDKQTWLEIATQLWELSPVGSSQLIDAIKANQ